MRATAERWGLVNRVVAPDELLPTAKKLAHEMAQVDGALLKRIEGGDRRRHAPCRSPRR